MSALPGAFLRQRSEAARKRAVANLHVSALQVSEFVGLAASLADRMEKLPPPLDLAARRLRQDRIARLRAVVAAGERSLDQERAQDS